MRLTPRALPLLLLLGALGCSDAQLSARPPEKPVPRDNKLTVTTELCLDTPAEVQFPVKVLFVIDTSTSMEISDPANPMEPDPTLSTGRARAVRQVIDRFRDQPGFSVGLIKFGASSNVLTDCGMAGPCFIADTTANQGKLMSAVAELAIAAGTTDYEAAMSTAFQMISNDLKTGDKVSVGRSKYVVIFMSDGLPAPQTADSNNPQTITKVVGDLMTLGDIFGVGSLKVHTALLATDKPDFIVLQEEVVLKAMAQRGRGLYRSFENGERINFLGFDITSLRRSFALKSFLALPLNTTPTGPRLIVDSDGDGLSDEQERLLGTSPIKADTDGDGFSDQLEHRFRASGFDPLNPGDADCALPDDRKDTDGDGVIDCEERFVGASRFLVDSDGDGMPDGVELRAGTDPTSADVIQDTDQDGTRNDLEVIGHSDPVRPDAENRSQLAQRYTRADLPPDPAAALNPAEAARPCFSLTVENISLLQGLPGAAPDKGALDTGGWNKILLWASEVPFDDPGENGTFKVACVEARYFDNGDKYPPTGRIDVPREAWRNAGEPLSCVGP